MAKKVSIKAGYNKHGIKVISNRGPATGKATPSPHGRSIGQNLQISRKYVARATSYHGIVESDD